MYICIYTEVPISIATSSAFSLLLASNAADHMTRTPTTAVQIVAKDTML